MRVIAKFARWKAIQLIVYGMVAAIAHAVALPAIIGQWPLLTPPAQFRAVVLGAIYFAVTWKSYLAAAASLWNVAVRNGAGVYVKGNELIVLAPFVMRIMMGQNGDLIEIVGEERRKVVRLQLKSGQRKRIFTGAFVESAEDIARRIREIHEGGAPS